MHVGLGFILLMMFFVWGWDPHDSHPPAPKPPRPSLRASLCGDFDWLLRWTWPVLAAGGAVLLVSEVLRLGGR